MKSINTVLVAMTVVALLISGCSGNKQPATASALEESATKYTCPMHPQILEDHPGSCPICGMTLIRKSGQASEGAAINLETVLQPVNSDVISSVKAVVPEEKQAIITIPGEGYLDYDTRTFHTIAAWYTGRIEKLYIHYAFELVHQGERLFDIYSPDMVTAQQDLIYLMNNSPTETGLIRAARQKLTLLGMTAAQIDHVVQTGQAYYSLPVYSPYDGHVHDAAISQMREDMTGETPSDFAANRPLAIKEGTYVEKGQPIFNIVDPHRLWAVIQVNPSDAAGLKENQPVRIALPDQPGKTLHGKIGLVEPLLEKGNKTTGVRVYLDNMDHSLKVNSLVTAEIQTGVIKGLWIPRQALTDLGQAKIVWLKDGATYRAHKISVGIVNDGNVLVTRGLSATDSLASNAQYLTDSEGFIKTKDHE
jgi:Cu(I)/Ag(I) efflux system membrane fusion protein